MNCWQYARRRVNKYLPQKFLHCSWWGLRSLSSQVQRRKDTRETLSKDVDLWLTREGLPSNLKEVIMNTHITLSLNWASKFSSSDDLTILVSRRLDSSFALFFYSKRSETACWQYAYSTENEYEHNSFDCDDASRNITLLNGLCPINPPNPTLFDLGVFTDALRSGMLGSTDFPQKFFICFWWGLRNLSSLGQNLQPSTTAWENLFAVFISITGLLLFLYLIGNLQVGACYESLYKLIYALILCIYMS
ncbi:putative Ion transport domain-containing protein [Rosa chinensis]|uniref:Putative Ion transport domain-containing protein n=1 Tax=Rosa chinensis TaxID=74649 RepID=A0A2P6SP53_ROSCH|nr:putative Ion transport domain-containing protein [Rosa chinensis]